MILNICATEEFTTYIVRESIEIDTDNYPELEGMTEEEMKDYIRENIYDMKSSNEEWYDNLYDEARQTDIQRDKIYNEETDIIFDEE